MASLWFSIEEVLLCEHGVATEGLCFAVAAFACQLTVHILKTMNVLVCGQSIIPNYFNFF